MKKRLIPLLLALCLSVAAVFGGCHVNLNLSDNGSSRTQPSAAQDLSSLARELESKLNSLTDKEESTSEAALSSSPQESAPAVSADGYTMADIKKLKNTEHFAKNTLAHIFDGTINSKGKATGYHYSKVSDSKGEIIAGTESKKDSRGVFTAKVKVNGVKKNGFSTFYPESWTPQQVVDAINEAYQDALSDKSNPHGSLWIGYSGELEIDMYLDSSKKITTAYPIYEGD